MGSYSIGLILSVLISISLLMLFRYEERVGVRFALGVRKKLDAYAVGFASFCTKVSNVIGKDSVRQVFHYILHSFLKLVLMLSKRWEYILRSMMRANKVIARKAEKERETRNKLEEIALHKIKHALTEEEKKKYKDTLLQGK